jgi:hypothetical protein
MLNKIVAISGKSGVFQIVTQGKNRIIVESLLDRKRIPVFSTEKSCFVGRTYPFIRMKGKNHWLRSSKL